MAPELTVQPAPLIARVLSPSALRVGRAGGFFLPRDRFRPFSGHELRRLGHRHHRFLQERDNPVTEASSSRVSHDRADGCGCEDYADAVWREPRPPPRASA
jgi:hypothetical protein